MQYTTFGPGSLESITLAHRTRHIGYDRAQVKATGSWTVYCGFGNDHSVAINTGWQDLGDALAESGQGVGAFSDQRAVIEWDLVAGTLVDWELEDWSDPCDTGE